MKVYKNGNTIVELIYALIAGSSFAFILDKFSSKTGIVLEVSGNEEHLTPLAFLSEKISPKLPIWTKEMLGFSVNFNFNSLLALVIITFVFLILPMVLILYIWLKFAKDIKIEEKQSRTKILLNTLFLLILPTAPWISHLLFMQITYMFQNQSVAFHVCIVVLVYFALASLTVFWPSKVEKSIEWCNENTRKFLIIIVSLIILVFVLIPLIAHLL